MYRNRTLGNSSETFAGLRGGATVEFALILLVLVPLLLGTGVVGVNMIRTLQTVQLARDAGHMYARGVNFSQPGNQTILMQLGQSVGLQAGSAGSAVVTFSSLTYVDTAACASVGAVNSNGVPTSACTNFHDWVFTQWMVIGNAALRRDGIGSPLVSGPTGVTVNSTTGQITPAQYVTRAGAVATFSSINPYADVNGTVTGLPSGQFLYVAEAGVQGFSMAPFVTNGMTYSYGIF
jgi:Flp pilus assembly protein TadG